MERELYRDTEMKQEMFIKSTLQDAFINKNYYNLMLNGFV